MKDRHKEGSLTNTLKLTSLMADNYDPFDDKLSL